MLTAALFTVAETWKPPRHPSTDEGVNHGVRYIHIYTRVCMHIIKKEAINAMCSNMDPTRDYHPKRIKPERKRQIPYGITPKWSLKYGTNEPIH